MKVDITENFLYVKSLENVIKSEISPENKIQVSGREKDGFVYILSGECNYKFANGGSFTAKEGDLLYLANNSFYSMKVGKEKYSFIYCDFIFNGDGLTNSAVYKIDRSSGIENLFKSLYERFLLKSSGWQADCVSLLYKIYGLIIEFSTLNYVSKSNKEKIVWAGQYVKDNCNVTVFELAQKLGITEVYFRKLFRSVYNKSPSQYVIFQRIERAKALMEYPFLSIEECAERSGFSSVQYFGRAFKKVTGVTPARFRKQIISKIKK